MCPPLNGFRTDSNPVWARCGHEIWSKQSMAVFVPPGLVLAVVGTGVDPVTSRFSGARSTN